jgi:hypothetical protein
MRTAAAVLGLLCMAAFGANDKDKTEKPEKPADRLVPIGTLVGVVQDTGDSTGQFVVRVILRHLEANPSAHEEYIRQQEKILRRQDAILKSPDIAQRSAQMQQLYQEIVGLLEREANLFKVKEVEQDVELKLAEDVKVRTAVPAKAYDDKGNIKRYTAKELRELRGKQNLPGYAAEVGDLQVGQRVAVKVAVRRRNPPPKKPGKDEAPKESSLKDMPPPVDESKPLAVLIVIADPMK